MANRLLSHSRLVDGVDRKRLLLGDRAPCRRGDTQNEPMVGMQSAQLSKEPRSCPYFTHGDRVHPDRRLGILEERRREAAESFADVPPHFRSGDIEKESVGSGNQSCSSEQKRI